MKNNFENIPAEIFDWLAESPFALLPFDKRKTVLASMSAEEYDELHESNRQIQQIFHPYRYAHSGKEELLHMFDEKYRSEQTRTHTYTALRWKAACVVLLFSTLWFALRNSAKEPLKELQTIVRTDTIFLEKKLVNNNSTQNASIVSEPAYRTAQSKKAVLPSQGKSKASPEPETDRAAEDKDFAVVPVPSGDFQILSVSSYQNVSNTVKRNSMYDDSLEKNFKFVSM